MSSTRNVGRHHLIAALAGALGAASLIPAGASAANSWFGSSLDHSPANAGSTCAENGVPGAALCTHVGSYYPGNSGHAAAPFNGTITAFRVEAQGPTTLTFMLVTVRNLSSNEHSGQAKVVLVGPTVTVKGTEDSNGDAQIETFHTNLNVTKGEELAVNTTSNTAEYCSDGTPGQLLFDPVLNPGQNFRKSNGVDGCLMLVQAVIKH
jgi:hypothetical protein